VNPQPRRFLWYLGLIVLVLFMFKSPVVAGHLLIGPADDHVNGSLSAAGANMFAVGRHCIFTRTAARGMNLDPAPSCHRLGTHGN
jgi:hypothetical protein